MKVKILLTGADGFVGSPLTRALAARYDRNAVVAARRKLVRAAADHDQVEVDVSPDFVWRKALRGVSVVVHAAARVHLLRETSTDPLAEFRRVNTLGTLNLARQSAAAGVKRFVFISTIKVNGESTFPDRPFTADDAPAPQDPYAISKYEAEVGLMQLAAQSGMEVVIIRPPLVYGPGVKANFLTMMRWLHRGVPLPLGGIRNQRSLLALDNLVDFVLLCVTQPAAANQIFLVSDGEDLSTTELLRRTARALGKRARLWSVPRSLLMSGLVLVGLRDTAVRLNESLQVDTIKSRNVLGWAPPISVDEGLRRTVEYFLQTHR